MKRIRQEKIMEMIREQDVETQEELAERLRAAGFTVTQATVSRDIRELRLSKAPGRGGRQKYEAPRQEEGHWEDKYSRVLKDSFQSFDMAQNILVIRTVSGMAMAAAAALDAMELPEVVGSIAGDDTIFVAVRGVEERKALAEKLQRMLYS